MLFIPLFVTGQTEDSSKKRKKEVGQENLTFDVGVFWFDPTNLYDPRHGLTIGIEKRRQRFLIAPTFGNNRYFSESNKHYQLSGFLVDYSFIILHPIKQFDLALFTQFYYDYQARDVNYLPPAEDLIHYSQSFESINGFFGLEARINIWKSLNIYAKYALGKAQYISEKFYPYNPPNSPYSPTNNRYTKFHPYIEMKMIGISYGFPTRQKLPEE